MASIKKRPNGMYRARYRDADGKEHSRHFKFKTKTLTGELSAQEWLDQVTASVVTGTYVDPKKAKLTVGEWCQLWLAGVSEQSTLVSAAGSQSREAHRSRVRHSPVIERALV